MDCFNGIGSLAAYEILSQVGEGAYGKVYIGMCKKSNCQVALKRYTNVSEKNGFPLTSIREVKFLKSLKHKNIVELLSIVSSKGCEQCEEKFTGKSSKAELIDETVDDDDTSKKQQISESHDNNENYSISTLFGSLYLVFEYVEHDLGGLVDSKYKFSQRSIKCIIKQLFEALDYLNEKKVIHRDIKSSNILIGNFHQVKLADFGLARSTISYDGREGRNDMTNNVVTLWYKSPELLLGATRYTSAIDTWAAGLVLAELELSRPLFPGRSEVEQYEMITRILGSPTDENFTSLSDMPNFETLSRHGLKHPNTLRAVYGNKMHDQSISMLERILILDPENRPSPKIILTHSFFFSFPMPPINPHELEPLQLPNGPSLHEYETKMRRKIAQRELDNQNEITNADKATVCDWTKHQSQQQSTALLLEADINISLEELRHSQSRGIETSRRIHHQPPVLSAPTSLHTISQIGGYRQMSAASVQQTQECAIFSETYNQLKYLPQDQQSFIPTGTTQISTQFSVPLEGFQITYNSSQQQQQQQMPQIILPGLKRERNTD